MKNKGENAVKTRKKRDKNRLLTTLAVLFFSGLVISIIGYAVVNNLDSYKTESYIEKRFEQLELAYKDSKKDDLSKEVFEDDYKQTVDEVLDENLDDGVVQVENVQVINNELFRYDLSDKEVEFIKVYQNFNKKFVDNYIDISDGVQSLYKDTTLLKSQDWKDDIEDSLDDVEILIELLQETVDGKKFPEKFEKNLIDLHTVYAKTLSDTKSMVDNYLNGESEAGMNFAQKIEDDIEVFRYIEKEGVKLYK